MPIIEQTPISDAWIINRRAHDQTTKHHPLVKSWPLTKSSIIVFLGQFKRFNHGYCKCVWSCVWLVIYLWSKVVCFVVSHVEISQTIVLHVTHLVSLESSWWEGVALTWFEIFWSYGVDAIDYWTIFSMKTK
jgi:hypothetical protein